MDNGFDAVLKLENLSRIADWQHQLSWKPFREGIDIYRLYGAESGPRAALLRFQPGARVPLHEHTGYEHIFVLSGSQSDENGQWESGALIINPPGSRHSVLSTTGCIVLAIYERPVSFIEKGAIPAV